MSGAHRVLKYVLGRCLPKVTSTKLYYVGVSVCARVSVGVNISAVPIATERTIDVGVRARGKVHVFSCSVHRRREHLVRAVTGDFW